MPRLRFRIPRPAVAPVSAVAALTIAACWRAGSAEPVAPPPEISVAGSPLSESAADSAADPQPHPPLPAPPPPRRIPAEPAEVESDPIRIRVGLATDRTSVELPAGRTVVASGKTFPLSGPVTVRPDARVRARPVWRLQVAALKDEGQAEGLAARLRSETGQPAEATFDASSDLYRVRWGRFGSRDDADDARGALATHGVLSAWSVSEGGALSSAALELHGRTGGPPVVVDGRDILVRADEPIFDFEGTRHRGSMRIYLNDRGLLNVIADLPLEDYLRGVVPKEMGPALYPEPESLRAQAVAARTFTLLNFDAFDEEGYDLCSTPRCQVYGGLSVEHPLSDRAIRETEGQVLLLDGHPVETLYSATCGGHTEDVSTVFPAKSGAHLRGVPCLEQGAVTLGSAGTGGPYPDALTRRIVPAEGTGRPESTFRSRVERIARAGGMTVPLTDPPLATRRDLLRWSAESFGEPAPPSSEGANDTWLALTAAWAGVPDGPVEATDREAFLEALARRLEVWTTERVAFLGSVRDRLRFHRGGPAVEETVSDLVTFAPPPAGRPAAQSALELAPGDPVDLHRFEGRVVAVAQPRPLQRVSLARHADRQRWTRTRSHAEVRGFVQRRYPGFPFADLRVLRRGVSGRIGAMEMVGDDGRVLPVEGLAVRWTLELPDTSFEWVRPASPDGGPASWFFRGTGWGHGVGLCQIGSFGMARRGLTYREILHHYYGGVELGHVRSRRFVQTGGSRPGPS